MSCFASSRLRFTCVAAALVGFLSAVPSVSADDPDLQRDRAVIVAVLLDMMDPKNPLNENYIKNTGHPGSGVIVDLTTRTSKDDPDGNGLELEDLDQLVKSGDVPKALSADLRRRYRGPAIATKTLGITDKRVVFADVRGMTEKADFDEGAFHDALEKTLPKSWGYVIFYPPGYSSDGSSALVYAYVGPSPHGMTETYLLKHDQGVWKVTKRWREIGT